MDNMTEEKLYDQPFFVQPGLWDGELRFYRYDNNLGASVRIGGSEVVFQTIRFPNGGQSWEPANLRGIRNGPLHQTAQVESLLREIKDFPWGA